MLRAIEDQFATAFPRRVWVFGTVHGLRGADDQLEFLLVEAGAEFGSDVAPRTLPSEMDPGTRDDVDASLRRLHDVAVEDLLVEGHLIRAGGLLSYDTTRHTIVFSITALDPQPTSAWLDDRRSAVREAVDHARLAERQGDVQLPLAPRSVGLVGTAGDPTLAEVRTRLAGSGFAIEVTDYPVSETGVRTAGGIAHALREASQARHDVVLLVRAYGRPLALAPYDDEAVIRAVATAPVPILTGLGAPEVPAAVESVAHQAHPTAAEASDSLIRKLQRAADQIEVERRQVAVEAEAAVRRGAMRVEQVRSTVLEDLRAARSRAEAVKKKRLLRVRMVAALLAVLVIVVALVTGIYALFAALVVPLGLALFSERLRPKRRRPPMAVRDLSFAQALNRLGGIREHLQGVADPDEVDTLEQEADALTEHCRALLRRPRDRQGAAAGEPRGSSRPTSSPPSERPFASREDQPPFDQFADRDDRDDRNEQADDATVSLPVASGDVHGRDEADGDAPTENLSGSPNRTVTLPGDATGPLATNSGARAAGAAASDTRANEDDTPTSVLPPR